MQQIPTTERVRLLERRQEQLEVRLQRCREAAEECTAPNPSLGRVLDDVVPAPSTLRAGVAEGLDAITLKGLERQQDKRFATALEMVRELEKVIRPAGAREIGEWVEGNLRDPLILLAGVVILGVVSAIACAIPARHAAKVDPMTALRCE